MKIKYAKQPKKYIEKLPVPRRTALKAAIEKLPAGDVSKLDGYKITKRLRVGKYRVLFVNEGDTIIVRKAYAKGDAYNCGY